MRIARITDPAAVHQAADLFDTPPIPAATERFLASPTHHLLLAYDDNDTPIGMITAVELTHPDKGTELFLYELGVAEPARRQGVATALLDALTTLARDHDCTGIWVLTEPDNTAALATYRRANPDDEETTILFAWTL